MKVLVIFLILLSFNSYSQLDTNKAIIGEWNLAYYKETSVMIDKESEFISTKNDSIIRLSINKETVKIFRKSYLSTDTFSFKYSIKSSNFKYGNKENNLILKLDKKTKKRVKRYYKNKLNEISFSIKKINNTQLAIENHSFDFHFINPLFYQSRKTYSFEKVNTVKDSLEKQFTGLWFSCENIDSLKNIDTIQFTKDTCFVKSKLSIKEVELPCKKSFELEISSKPDFNQWTFSKLETCSTIQFASYKSNNHWFIEPKTKKLILFVSETEKLEFNYRFQNGLLKLVKR